MNYKFMNRISAISLFLTLAVSLALASCTDKKKEGAKSMLEEAKAFYVGGKYDSALALCNTALQNDTSLTDAEYYKGKCLRNLNKYDEAILSFEKCIGRKFKLDTANMLIGQSFFALGYKETSVSGLDSLENIYYQRSINYSDSALRLNDKLYYAHTSKISSLHNMLRFKEALDAVNKSILLFPDSLDLFVQRAIEKGSLNDHKTAIDEFSELEKKISDIDSFYASMLYRYRGLSHSELKEHRKAVEDFTRALDFEGDNEMIYYNRAISYYYLRNKDKCCEDLRKSADLGFIIAYDLIENICRK